MMDTSPRGARYGSCSAWDEDHEADGMMVEALTRSASAAQREARAPRAFLSNQPKQLQATV